MLKQAQRAALLLLLNAVGLKEAGSLWEELLQFLLLMLLLVARIEFQQLKLLGFQESNAVQLELLLNSIGIVNLF